MKFFLFFIEVKETSQLKIFPCEVLPNACLNFPALLLPTYDSNQDSRKQKPIKSIRARTS
ncbi:hypothetical protein CpB0599 [Chlamydia pneumoniae TW-183]|uniref:Uncharacterized protein n=1 Tax=Chlamydia pneumoniae TaxID=83558 RepID=A0ABN3YQ43_CHLPN|nr:hypothetical protein CpB0599 [Chlamydia pneumoniae TW-183]